MFAFWVWRDNSVAESTGYVSRGLKFGSKLPHGGSYLPLTPVPGDLMSSSGLLGHQAHMWCMRIYVGKTPISVK